jgi:ribosomal protein S18 acetylase RimI-like enzyme
MVPLDPPLRLATEADAPVLAVLHNEASHGLVLHAWRLMAEPGADPWAFGTARQMPRVRNGFWVVVDEGAGPVAGLLARPPEIEALEAGLPAVFPPLIELEALEPGTLFVQVLAALPPARGRGLGTRLMRTAEDIAREWGRSRLSLIAADDNADGRRLYGRLGYRERARRPMVKAGWNGPGSEWILLVKELEPAC